MLWSVLGVWGVVWVVMLVVAAVAIVVAVVALVRRRSAKVLPGVPLYLDEPTAIAICRLGGYDKAVKRKVERFRKVNQDGSFTVDSRWFKFGGGGKRQDEEHSTYDVDDIAYDVLGITIKALEANNGIVHVDLPQRTIVGNRAWRGTRVPRMSGIRQPYVVLEGDFEVEKETGGKTVLHAAVGGTGAVVRVECDVRSLRRDDVPDGRFSARCLGKYQSWKDETGEIVILPVAVLQ